MIKDDIRTAHVEIAVLYYESGDLQVNTNQAFDGLSEDVCVGIHEGIFKSERLLHNGEAVRSNVFEYDARCFGNENDWSFDCPASKSRTNPNGWRTFSFPLSLLKQFRKQKLFMRKSIAIKD